MEWTAQNSKLIAGVLALLLTGSVVGGIYFWDKTGDLAKENDKTTLKADSLLSVKLSLERDIHNLSQELASANTDKESLNQKLNSTQKLLSQKNHILTRLQKESKIQQEDVSDLNNQVAELTQLKNDLKAEIETYQNEKNKWVAENNSLKKSNEGLQTQVNDLTTQLGGMVSKDLITANNFRVDVLKNNNKVTAKAKKANTILVSLTLPKALSGEGSQQIYLSLTDLENRPMSGAIQNVNVKNNESTLEVPVHVVQSADFGRNPQKIVFEFEPSTKVPDGTYKANVYTTNAYLGSIEFHLRDSFLFF